MSCNSEIPLETIVFNQREWVNELKRESDPIQEELYYDTDDEYDEHPRFFTNHHYCQICNKTRSDNFIILNCNHTFHINCLANFHLGLSSQRNCAYCKTYIEDLELKYLHNKFCDTVSKDIINMKEKLDKLQNKIKKIQESIRQTEHEKKRSEVILDSMN